MIRIEKTSVSNFEGAIRGMRNPMNSWDKSDSKRVGCRRTPKCYLSKDFELGPNDLDLCCRLIKSGSDHRKFVRQIFVCMDVTAPLYWWKEFDTYKVATVANSTSTMHKIHSKPISMDDFSTDHLAPEFVPTFEKFIADIEQIRLQYLEEQDADKKKLLWYTMIQSLPESYEQTRTITLNYETLFNIYRARKNHKQQEWHTFCDWILGLPYMKEFLAALGEV